MKIRFACLGLSLGFVQPTLAQTVAEPDLTVITVTATRITRDGYSAPTPLTVFGEEDLERAGQINAFTAANQLPSLAGSNSTSTFGTTQSTGTGGLSTLNLRGLGTNRTLTLLDNQRVVGALNIGVTDAGAFPQALVKRVEIVTGGASASWGSDAVAGVVNYVLDHDFTGVKGTVNGGVTTYGDDEQYIVSLTAGTKFADDRAHFIISGEYQNNDGIPRGIGDRDWYDGTRILQRTIAGTPPGQPQYIVAPNVVDMRLAPGGLITAGPLMGTAFGPGGAPYTFQYGSLIASPNMSGGDQSGDVGNNSNLDSTLERETLYVRLAYDLTPNMNVYATFNHGGVETTAHSFPGQYRTGNLTIQCTNAFLPAEIAAACANNYPTGSMQFGSFIADLPDSVAVNERTMDRFAVGLDAELNVFDRDWNLNAYYSNGTTVTDSTIENGTLNPLIFAAIDAVRAPDGSIVCRSELARANGCVPLNIIGTGVASQAAIDWVSGAPFLHTRLKQEVAAVSVSGDVFDNWAGPVSLALGAEYRRESFSQRADAASTGNAGNPLLSANGNNWFTGNFRPSEGEYDVVEGFAETVLPIVDTDAAGKAELNLAARATEYSEAGYVTTWKIGATWETPLTGLRLRALQSRDIRAPNLSELFRAPQNLTGTVIDRFAPYEGQSFTVNQATLANTDLEPELGTTKQIGVIYQPEWLPGFSTSVDYYRISVEDAIGTITAQQEMDLCFQGNQELCDFIVRDATSLVTEIQLKPVNLASTLTDGVDIEASYRTALSNIFTGAPGDLTIRALATHVIKFDTDSGIPNAIITEAAGQNSGNIARWRIYGTQTYSTDRYSVTLTQRYVSPGVIANNWIECTSNCPAPTINNPTVNNNHIKGALYWDLGGSYEVGTAASDFRSQVYFKIDNLFNLDPPKVPTAGINPYLVRSTNSALYDLLGRTYRLGVRFSF
ncbi:MAG TPA: TonB-dependent receptor plug domain-containing protein [Steroidobacter sp.]|uniref:TonB-dependent receptor plug domain-containing protein n=1 Tax=Steroidobacter sp. TaxID=1978227 RepID=UPI002ED93ABD